MMMKITLYQTFDDNARRQLAIARKCETTKAGLATREALEQELYAVLAAHWQDIQSDAEEMEKMDRG